jgi:hypothetical protein
MSRLSISKTEKNKGGRPRVDATPVMVRLAPDQLKRLDKWIAAQKAEQVGRPEAIRRLMTLGLSAVERGSTLDEQIAVQEEKIARKVPQKRSPAKGMAQLRKGLAENDYRKLIVKKEAKAASRSIERSPKVSGGKKGGDT